MDQMPERCEPSPQPPQVSSRFRGTRRPGPISADGSPLAGWLRVHGPGQAAGAAFRDDTDLEDIAPVQAPRRRVSELVALGHKARLDLTGGPPELGRNAGLAEAGGRQHAWTPWPGDDPRPGGGQIGEEVLLAGDSAALGPARVVGSGPS